MNKIERQVDKNKRRENNRFKKWWRNNNYKVWRALLFWIWIPIVLWDNIDNKHYTAMKYSDEETKRHLDKVMPYLVAHWREEPNCFLMTNASDMGGIRFRDGLWDLPRKYRKQRRYFLKFYDYVTAYIVRKYQIEGYEKFPILTSGDWYSAKEKFDWGGVPYSDDIVKGVVFYK